MSHDEQIIIFLQNLLLLFENAFSLFLSSYIITEVCTSEQCRLRLTCPPNCAVISSYTQTDRSIRQACENSVDFERDCANAQTDLDLYCSQMPTYIFFLMHWLVLATDM